MSEFILLNRLENGVAEIVLNRPAKLNAMTPEMAAAVRNARREINDDETIRAVVVRGAGEKAFSAGTDIGQLDSFRDAWAFRNRVCYATEFRRIKKPTIAALKGWVVGGGLEIAINCDIRVAAPSAKLGAPEVKHGWLGGGGQTQMLVRLVGYGKASMMCLTGETYDAETSYRMGLIEQMSAEGEEVAKAHELANKIAAHTLVATMTVKEGIRAALNGTLDGASRYENDLMVLAFALGNQRRGIDSFMARKSDDK
jgi:enoyl-CoA hydratase/carnithine racemase